MFEVVPLPPLPPTWKAPLEPAEDEPPPPPEPELSTVTLPPLNPAVAAPPVDLEVPPPPPPPPEAPSEPFEALLTVILYPPPPPPTEVIETLPPMNVVVYLLGGWVKQVGDYVLNSEVFILLVYEFHHSHGSFDATSCVVLFDLDTLPCEALIDFLFLLTHFKVSST